MRTLYLDCGMGAAGDMLAAALYELVEEKEAFLRQMNALGLPGVKVTAEPSEKCGITGTHMKVTVDGVEEEPHAHTHEHAHGHHHAEDGAHENEHEHHHRGMGEIEKIILSLPLSRTVRENILSVYRLIAEAESAAHGVPVSEIHFHEVGTMDAIADVAAVCLLMEQLAVDEVVASPVHVGGGHVRCAHGILPVPAPATAFLLRGVPVYGGGVKGELCTPTGAALLKFFAGSFGPMPLMEVEKIGYGMGKKDFEAANCVRAMVGKSEGANGEICELACNLDDMTPERIGFAMERLFEAGALEVYTTPVGMKKSRPGVLLSVLCEKARREELVRLIFRHTSTLGIRETRSRRYTLRREVRTRSTPFGDVTVKRAEGYGSVKEKYEYEELARIAKEENLNIADVIRRMENG